MESAAVRLYFLLEHNYNLVTMSCILHIIWVNSCTRNKINFSKDNIARGLCTLVPFIVQVPTVSMYVYIQSFDCYITNGHEYVMYLCTCAVEMKYIHVINPRRMRSEGYSSRSVCLSVCLFVCLLFVSNCSRTTGYVAAYERYQQIQCYKGRKNNVAILLKRLRSRDMA